MAESLLTVLIFTFHCVCGLGCNFVFGICKLKPKKTFKTKNLKS